MTRLAVIAGVTLFVLSAATLNAQQTSENSDATSNPAQPSSVASAQSSLEREIETQEREIGDEDPTYFQTRTTVKYDHKWVPGDTSKDRLRSFSLVSFSMNKSWAFTVELPFVVRVATPEQETTGVGDFEFKLGKMLTKTERFRQAIATQMNFQTSSHDMIGGSATVLKGYYYISYVPARDWMLFGALNYAHSVHLSDGASTVSTIEPELTISRGFPWFAVYLYFDNYYDFPVSEWGNTVKVGIAKAFGKRQLWAVDVYNEHGINRYARRNFTNDLGINVTRYFGAK